jgi:hypothetical protein
MPKNYEDIFDVMGGIILLAIIARVVSSPNTAKQITAAGQAFSGSLSAALGK